VKVWWVWEVGFTGEGKEGRRRDAGAIAEEFRRRRSPVTPTSPEGYAAKGASAALPLLDDARWHRLRRGALHLHPWRRNQTHHTFTTACYGQLTTGAPSGRGFASRAQNLMVIPPESSTLCSVVSCTRNSAWRNSGSRSSTFRGVMWSFRSTRAPTVPKAILMPPPKT